MYRESVCFASMLREVVEELSDTVLCILSEGRKGWSGVLGLGLGRLQYIDVAGENVARMMGALGREGKGRDLLGPVLKGGGWCRMVL